MRKALIAFQREANTAVRALVNNTTFDMTPLTNASNAIPAGVTIPTLDIKADRAKFLTDMVIAYANAPANRVTNAGFDASAINIAVAEYQKVGKTPVKFQDISPSANDDEKNAINAAGRVYNDVVKQQGDNAKLAIAQGDELIEEGNSIENALVHYAAELSRKPDVTVSVKKNVGEQLAKDILAFTKDANAKAAIMEGEITKALAAYNKEVARVQAAIDARMEKLRDSVITYINQTFDAKANAAIADIDTIKTQIQAFKNKLTLNEKFKSLIEQDKINDIITKKVTPYERVHQNVVSRIEESIKRNEKADDVKNYFVAWDRISKDVWYTEVKAYLLALARGNTQSPLNEADTTILKNLANVFETEEERLARKKREEEGRRAKLKDFFDWVDSRTPFIGSARALEILSKFEEDAPIDLDVEEAMEALPGFRLPKMQGVSVLPGSIQDNDHMLFGADIGVAIPFNALYVQGVEVLPIVECYRLYAEYLVTRSDADKNAFVNYDKWDVPIQPTTVTRVLDPRIPIGNDGTFPLQPVVTANDKEHLFSLSAQTWAENSCWINAPLMSLFNIRQSTWSTKLFKANMLNAIIFRLNFPDGTTEDVSNIDENCSDQLQSLHKTLLDDVTQIQDESNTQKTTCATLRNWIKARECLTHSTVSRITDKTPGQEEALTFFYSFVNLYGAKYLGIELREHKWSTDKDAMSASAASTDTRAVIVNASEHLNAVPEINNLRLTKFVCKEEDGFELAAIVCKSGKPSYGHYVSYVYDFKSKQWAFFNELQGPDQIGWVKVLSPNIGFNDLKGLPTGALNLRGPSEDSIFKDYSPAFFVFVRNVEVQEMLQRLASATPTVAPPSTEEDILRKLGFPNGKFPTDLTQKQIVGEIVIQLKSYNGAAYFEERKRIMEVRLSASPIIAPTPTDEGPLLQKLGFKSGNFPNDPTEKLIVQEHVKELKDYKGNNLDEYVTERKRIMEVRLSELPFVVPIEFVFKSALTTDEKDIVEQYVRAIASSPNNTPYKEERLRIAKTRLGQN
jgi:hypothetical protein